MIPQNSQNQGEDVPGEVLHEILKEIDTNRNGQVEIEEYLAVKKPLYIFMKIFTQCKLTINSITIQIR